MFPPESLLPVALNHLLKRETWAREKLMAHAGKSARFEIGPVTINFLVEGDGLVSPVVADQGPSTPAAPSLPSVTIRIRAADLPLIFQQRDRAFSFVRIEGDAEFAATISELSHALRWDVGDDLGTLMGDIAANRIVTGGNAVLTALDTTRRSLMHNTAEYFLEEQPMLVRPGAVEDFSDDVVRLRDDVERMAKRIGRLS